MAIGLLIIGDEILSGKRTDRHFSKVIELLQLRGLQLGWAHYLGDDPERITDVLRRSMASEDIVFSCGGIGATPDDHTRRCAANAMGVPLSLHPFARERIRERIEKLAQEAGKAVDPNAPDNLNRMKMGEFPQGAEIIPNSFNNMPGFSIGTHYFVPGFPEMAWPMIEWVLDTHCSHLFHKNPQLEKSIILYGVMESALTTLMEEIEEVFPQVKTFSLPKVSTTTSRGHVELGVKGEPSQTVLAFEKLLAWMARHEVEYVTKDLAQGV